MTIRSVDMQVLVQKVTDVAKIPQTDKADHHNRQQQFMQQIAEQTDVSSRTVNQPQANDTVLIRDKQEKERRQRSSKKKKDAERSSEDQDSEWPRDPERGSNIDIHA